MSIDSLPKSTAEPLLQSGPIDASDKQFIRSLIDQNYTFIWRLLARLGVRASEVEDATQHVFMVLMTRERQALRPGSERSFLFGVAVRVAQEYRRRVKKHETHSVENFELFVDPGVDLETLADQQKARAILDKIVASMSEELRLVFVLFEFEGLSAADVGELLGIPAGTVASRMRRGRQHFRQCIAQMNIPGGLKGLR